MEKFSIKNKFFLTYFFLLMYNLGVPKLIFSVANNLGT